MTAVNAPGCPNSLQGPRRLNAGRRIAVMPVQIVLGLPRPAGYPRDRQVKAIR
jgi:hypothetical protein